MALKFQSVCDLLEDHGLAYSDALVAGCGNGADAVALARRFGGHVTGIDIDPNGFVPSNDGVTLEFGDVRELKYQDASFDFILSFHMIEHVLPPSQALAELRRVSRAGALVMTGTPNKSRLIGYIGADEPLLDRLRWNLADFKMRIRGRWSNEEGAHAGFTLEELETLSREHFGRAEDCTLDYYLKLYPKRKRLISLLAKAGLARLIFPSVYVIARVV